MNRLLKALALSCVILLASCGNGGPGTTPTPTPTPAPTPTPTPTPTPDPAPTVVSVNPADGATGVAADARIVVTFNQPMDQVATQAAYQSSSLPASAVTFDWDSAGTVLTITPNAPLETVNSTSFSTTPKSYDFRLTSVARDRAGNVLAPFHSSFTTLRLITQTLPTLPSLDGNVYDSGTVNDPDVYFLVGDTDTNVSIRGFLSFDLSSLPAGLTASALVEATLHLDKRAVEGYPYVGLNPCRPNPPLVTCVAVPVNLDHVVYGPSLNATDFDLPALTGSGTVDGALVPVGAIRVNVLDALKDDLANRASRANRSQYRLSFPLHTNGDGSRDLVAYSLCHDGPAVCPSISVVLQLP